MPPFALLLWNVYVCPKPSYKRPNYSIEQRNSDAGDTCIEKRVGLDEVNELDDYFDSSTKLSAGYEHVREVADSARMSIQNLINIISGYNEGQAQDIIDAEPSELKILEQEVEQEKELTSVKEDQLQTTREAEQVNDEVRSSFIDEIRKAINATKEETSTIEQLDKTSKDTSETQISNYKRIKQAIAETRAEIEKLNSQDLQNLKIPDYVEKTYSFCTIILK